MASVETTDTPPPATALVLAASRQGADDPVARLQGKSHKCLVEIDGTVMLEIVVRALLDSACFARVYVSIESAEILRSVPRLAQWLDEGHIGVVESRGSLADSVFAAAEEIPEPFPLIITTGDNALHTPEIIRDFMDRFRMHSGDVMAAFTSEPVVRADYPAIGLAFHRLKDDAYSACNLYGLRRSQALAAVNVFRGGGQFGKRHWRILKAFGVLPFLFYKFKLADLEGLVRRVARNLGVTMDAVLLPYSYGPIDVDNAYFFETTEETLRRRRLSA